MQKNIEVETPPQSLTEVLDRNLSTTKSSFKNPKLVFEKKSIKKKLRKTNTGSFHHLPSSSTESLFSSSSEKLDPNGSKIVSSARRRKHPRGGDEEEPMEFGENIITHAAVKDAIFHAQTKFFFDMKPCFIYYNFLSILLDLTDSSYGYMGTFSKEEDKITITGVCCKSGFNGSVLDDQISFAITAESISGSVSESLRPVFENEISQNQHWK